MMIDNSIVNLFYLHFSVLLTGILILKRINFAFLGSTKCKGSLKKGFSYVPGNIIWIFLFMTVSEVHEQRCENLAIYSSFY